MEVAEFSAASVSPPMASLELSKQRTKWARHLFCADHVQSRHVKAMADGVASLHAVGIQGNVLDVVDARKRAIMRR